MRADVHRLSTDNNRRTLQTLELMGKLVYAGGTNPRIRRTAVETLHNYEVPERDVPAMAAALFEFVKNTYYVWDPLDAEWLQKVGIQLDDIAARREGLDCDDKVILLASLGRAVGLPVVLKAISGQAASNGNFDHVYALIGDPRTGEWTAADPTQDVPLGWEPPSFVRWWVFDPGEQRITGAGGPQGTPPTPPRGGLSQRRGERASYLAPQLGHYGATGFGQASAPAELTSDELVAGGMRWWTDPRDGTQFLTSNEGISNDDYTGGLRTILDPYTRAPIGTFNVLEVEQTYAESIRGPKPVVPAPCDATATPAGDGGGGMPKRTTDWLAAFWKWADPTGVRSTQLGIMQGQAWDSIMPMGFDPFQYGTQAEANKARFDQLDRDFVGGHKRKINDSLKPYASFTNDEQKALATKFWEWRADCYGKRESFVAHPDRARELLLQEHGMLTQYQRELDEMTAEALTYIPPLLTEIKVLEARAAEFIERLEDRAAFLKLVNDTAGVVSAVLSTLGPFTMGITEVLSIAVAVGNLYYQADQLGKIFTGSSYKSLQAIGAGISQIAETFAWVENIAEESNAEWYVARDLKVAIMDALPAATLAAPVPGAAPPLEVTAASSTNKGGVGLLAAAAAAALMVLRAA